MSTECLGSNVVGTLIEALGPKVILGSEIPVRNHADASGLEPAQPLALILPRSTEDVATALRICHAHRQPIVIQGGLTGLAGGAHPKEGEVALSLERMSGIEEVDPASATLTALAGTPLSVVQQAADEAGFLCGIDLGARGTCTIGGNVATNAGGNQVLRYGMTRRNVLGLEAVMSDGKVVRSLNKMLKNNAGYDWTQMLIGSEGTLGVITRVVVALQPRPNAVQTALCAVSSFEDALAILRSFQNMHPGRLIVFEAMWCEFMDVAIRICGLPAPFKAEHEIALLIEADLDAEGFSAVLGDFYEQGLVKDAVVAQSRQDRARIWGYRETPYEYGRFLPEEIRFDVSIPLGRMSEAVAYLREQLPPRWPEAVFVVFGHVADSNVHINVALANMDAAAKKGIQSVVYDLIASLSGSVSAEHGIGQIKRPYLPLSRTEPELALMAAVKQTLDPAGILNPGRVL